MSSKQLPKIYRYFNVESKGGLINVVVNALLYNFSTILMFLKFLLYV